MAITLQEKFELVKKSMAQSLVGYNEIIDIWFRAITTRHSLLLFSIPGEAKTLFYNTFGRHISDADVIPFYIACHSHLKVEDELGPLSVKEFQNGKYERCIENYVIDPRVRFAMMDELARAKSIKNINLPLLNERQIKIGNVNHKSNIISFITGVNSEMKDPEDQALNERFAFRYQLPSIMTADTLDDFIMSHQSRAAAKDNPNVAAQISIADIEQAQQEVKQVVVATPDVRAAIKDIYYKLIKDKIIISKRTIEWWMQATKAEAWFDGRINAEPADLIIGNHMLWFFAEHKPTVTKIINSVVNQELDTMYQRMEEAQKLADAINGSSTLTEMKEIIAKLKSKKEAFDKMKHSKRNENEFIRIGKAITAIHRDVAERLIGNMQSAAS